jgi:hypothetical protein
VTAKVYYVRKDRRDSLTGVTKQGPTHIVVAGAQSLCGRRIPALSFWTSVRPTHPAAPKLCPACLKHEAAGTAPSWRKR